MVPIIPLTQRGALVVLVLLVAILTILASVFVRLARAFDLELTGSEITVTYTEPRLSSNGQPLQDLKETRIYISKGDGGPVQENTVPATNQAGGGTITSVLIVPVGPNQEADLTVYATAADRVGNESGPSNTKSVRVDRVPPAPPE